MYIYICIYHYTYIIHIYIFSYALKEGRARNPLIRVCVCVTASAETLHFCWPAAEFVHVEFATLQRFSRPRANRCRRPQIHFCKCSTVSHFSIPYYQILLVKLIYLKISCGSIAVERRPFQIIQFLQG